MPTELFPPADVAERIVVAAGCGLIVGLEREWAHKELGVRTFTIVSLFGALSSLVSGGFVIAAFVGVIALIASSQLTRMRRGEATETTTSAALMATFALGALAGEGHIFSPPMAVILMTLFLSMKPQLSRFAVGLSQEEVRGAVLLALIAFVIYPVLPDRFVDPWQLFNPREAWLIIVVISTIGFVNYVLLRFFSSRGLYYTAIFGGLVNSTAAIAELSTLLRDSGEDVGDMAIAVNLLTIVSMFARNLALLSIFSHRAGALAAFPILAMAALAATIAARKWRADTTAAPLRIGSPLELRKVVSFGLLFLVIQVASALGQRAVGTTGLVMVSALGGLASSASSTAAAASLASHGRIDPLHAAACAMAASIASLFANLPIIYRQFGRAPFVRRLVMLSMLVCLPGAAIWVAESFLTGM